MDAMTLAADSVWLLFLVVLILFDVSARRRMLDDQPSFRYRSRD